MWKGLDESMKLGTMVDMHMETLEEQFAKLRSTGFATCQLCCWQEERFTAANAERVRQLATQYEIEISAVWCGWDGPCEWNLVQGPVTVGLVPSAFRERRWQTLVRCSEFAEQIGVTDMITHVGFIPNNPFDPDYVGLVVALRKLAEYLKPRGQYFLFETGQEAPVTLLRTIEDIGCDNFGINLDPANLLLYGYGNPVDALDVFGKYVRGVHAKDGEYPVNGRSLGEEKQIGEGRVNFPALIAKLRSLGYDRCVTIEREISGEQQTKDIEASKLYLEQLISQS